MQKLSSLLQLVRSLTRQERKSFTIDITPVSDRDYAVLYRIIDKSPDKSPSEVRAEFDRKCPGSTFNTAVAYLFKRITDHIVAQKVKSEPFYDVFTQLLGARALYEKSLYEESFATIERAKALASSFDSDVALMMAQRMELDCLQATDFGSMSEEELLNLQSQLRSTMRSLTRLNEHSALYELMRFRTLRHGTNRSTEDFHALDDLVTSEISIMSSVADENFNILKNHCLFQANYFINVGDYRAAFNSYVELNSLFEENRHKWNNPPLYYLRLVQGLLESLRIMGDHQGMEFFIRKLEAVEATAGNFQLRVAHTAMVYRLASLIDRGLFVEATKLWEESREKFTDKKTQLSSSKQAELTVYVALAYLGAGDCRRAHRVLAPFVMKTRGDIAVEKMRMLRIVNLMVCYDLGDEELAISEAQSIKRSLAKIKEQKFATEQVIVKFVTTYPNGVPRREKEAVWAKYEPRLAELRSNKFEKSLLNKFDFTAWIKARILGLPLSECITPNLSGNK